MQFGYKHTAPQHFLAYYVLSHLILLARRFSALLPPRTWFMLARSVSESAQRVMQDCVRLHPHSLLLDTVLCKGIWNNVFALIISVLIPWP
jgi:hypothetical protein